MANQWFRISQAAVLGAVALIVAGCSNQASASNNLDPKAVAGTWVEVRGEAAEGTRVANTESVALGANLRQLTLNEDGTYSEVLVTPDGKPTGKQACTGTWKVQKRVIMFEARENSFDASIKGLMSPNCANCLQGRDTGDLMMLSDDASNSASLKRK